MGRQIRVLLFLLAASLNLKAQPEAFETAVKPFVETYCAVCHNPQAKAGSLDLTIFLKRSGAAAIKDRASWTRVLEKLNSGQMPPKGALLPSGEQIAPVMDWIEKALAVGENQSPAKAELPPKRARCGFAAKIFGRCR